MKNILHKNRVLLYAVVFALIFCTVFFAVQDLGRVALAADVEYSDVLDDLKVDSSFSADNYPSKIDDYSISLITIAEGKNNDVYAYVYQPSGKVKDYKASSINVSTSINDAISYYNYKLEFCNSYGVFYKYKITDLTVTQDNIRYYNITSIYRPFDEQVDEQASGGNTITEVPFAVNRQYAFGTVDGKPYVECIEIETIVVTDKFVGFVRYENGFTLLPTACDSHFVAFNTDKPMDKLLEADVYYTSRHCVFTQYSIIDTDNISFDEGKDEYAYLKYTDSVEHSKGWFAKTYKWDRIQTVDDFIAGENRKTIYEGAIIDVGTDSAISDDALSELKGKKWVLRFAETSYLYNHPAPFTNSYQFTIVADVTILRLKFETDGVVYNLGVIDNKQSGSNDPINDTDIEVDVNPEIKESLKKNFKWLLILLCIVIAIIALAPLLPYLIKGIVWLFTYPLKRVGESFENYHKKQRAKKSTTRRKSKSKETKHKNKSAKNAGRS